MFFFFRFFCSRLRSPCHWQERDTSDKVSRNSNKKHEEEDGGQSVSRKRLIDDLLIIDSTHMRGITINFLGEFQHELCHLN